MADILLTNDDGYNSVGFYPLLKELKQEFSVVSVVPDSQKSWVGKSISAKTPLKIKKVILNKENLFACSGTPADCAQIGIYDFSEKKPKLLVSGINIGDNAGHARILSSGTIGAAMESSIDGVKAIASSLYIPPGIRKNTDFFDKKNYPIFKNAAKITAKIIKIFFNTDFWKGIDLISINIPFKADINTEFMVTKPFKQPYGRLFYKKGEKYLHISPALEFKDLEEGTNLKAIYENKISITPIILELADESSFKRIDKLIRKSW
jgi:5'-nucleotidase